jgi:hypothetical protein
MAKKYAGIYLYYDWIDALSGIPAAKAMKIIKNLRGYAEHGVEPAPLDGTAGHLQNLFISQLQRSKVNAENGKMGGAPTHKNPYATKKNEVSEKAVQARPGEGSAKLSEEDYAWLMEHFRDEDAEGSQAGSVWEDTSLFGDRFR